MQDNPDKRWCGECIYQIHPNITWDIIQNNPYISMGIGTAVSMKSKYNMGNNTK